MSLGPGINIFNTGRLSRSLLACLFLAAPSLAIADGFTDLWLTPDQQGQRLFERERYAEAAEVFEGPARRASAYYRAGDFESAAAVFGALPGAEAAFNRGNALIFLGRYEEAIGSFDKALEDRPGWAEAEQNREIARVRFERLQPAEDDAGGTGGKLGADEIRFDDTGRVDKAGSEVTMEGDQDSTEASRRAVWLRRVQNDPGRFLETRFAYQLYRDTAAEGDDVSTDD